MSNNRKNFTVVLADGTTEKLSEELVPFAARIAPLAIAAIKGETVAEQSFRSIAEIIGELRMGYSFVGDPAGSKRGLPKSDFDYRGLSPACAKAEAQIWSAVVPTGHLAQWIAATRKSPSDYPLRKKVAYHLEVVIKELFVKNNPTLEGSVEPNGEMTGEVAVAFTATTGMDARSRTGRGNGKGKGENVNVLSPKTKPAETLKTVSGVFAELTAESFSEIHGKDRTVIVNTLKAMVLHGQNLIAEMTSATKPAADVRRQRAAEAAA